MAAIAVIALVGLARAFPSWWPAVAAPLAALAVLGIGFVAPVVLEPLFNRFEPLADEALARDLRGLGERAGVPVREVLVADASRRTTKVNAYVSGLGSTRRVVLYDTLLARSTPAELRLVVAHELGHRRYRHPAKATALGMVGAAVAVVVLWAALPDPFVLKRLCTIANFTWKSGSARSLGAIPRQLVGGQHALVDHAIGRQQADVEHILRRLRNVAELDDVLGALSHQIHSAVKVLAVVERLAHADERLADARLDPFRGRADRLVIHRHIPRQPSTIMP